MASGKKSKKTKGKTLALTDFLQETPGSITSLPIRKSSNWADEVEDSYDGYDSRYKLNNVVLPTAPKASRDYDDIDGKVPKDPPFWAYLSNLPYDVDEEEIAMFFKNLKIASMKIPKDDRMGESKLKGYGYVEFEDRDSLLSALAIPDTTLKSRRIRIEVAANVENDRRRGRMDMGRDRQERADVFTGDWRSGSRPESSEMDRNRSGFNRDREGGGGFTRGDNRDGGGFNRDRDRGEFTRENRDRDGGGFTRDRDGGGGGFTRDRDGGGGGFTRDRDGGGGGFTRDRDNFSRENREDDKPGSWRDADNERLNRNSDRPGFVRRNDRGNFDSDRGGSRFEDRDNDRRGGGGYGNRRFDNDNRDDRNGGSREARGGAGGEEDSSRQRPKLNLAPRTKPVEAAAATVTTETAVPSASIFGNAKPVDTSLRERQIEEKLAKEQDKPRDGSRDRNTQPPHERNFDRSSSKPISRRSESPEPQNREPVAEEEVKSSDEDRTPLPAKEEDDVDVEEKPKNDKPRREEKRDKPEKEMPKLKEAQPPNFAASNKFAFLETEDSD